MNRDTLYSSGVFDLDAGPLTITLPDAGRRFMSMQVINQDHYTLQVSYAPGRHVLDREAVGTRYVFIIVRTLANGEDARDIAEANRLQDAIALEQRAMGSFQVPRWDEASRDKARDALAVLGSLGGTLDMFGTREQVNPYGYLIGAAIGWGGNPKQAADYVSVYPKQADGETPYILTVQDVPVDGFWSISVYNARGFFEKNDLNAYSLNSLTARPGPDGSYTIRFGSCDANTVNCLPITQGWNYTVRLYRPRREILDGTWQFPEARPVK
jgi:para-nitrobenzyl esterase